MNATMRAAPHNRDNRGTLLLTAAVSGLGFALTRVLPETSGVSLEQITQPARTEPTGPATPPGIGANGGATSTRHTSPTTERGRSTTRTAPPQR